MRLGLVGSRKVQPVKTRQGKEAFGMGKKKRTTQVRRGSARFDAAWLVQVRSAATWRDLARSGTTGFGAVSRG